MQKHKQILNKIKTYKPDVFLIDFHGTIVSIKWEDEVILPYVIENLDNFLLEKWNSIELMTLIEKLREQSFIQRFQFKREDAPLIEEEPENDVLRSASNFIKWQIKNRKETTICLDIQRMIWEEGFKKKKLLTVVFDDVIDAFKKWKNNLIKIFILSSVTKNELILFLKHTSHGDLTPYICDYFDKEIGNRMNKQTYLQIAKYASSLIDKITFLTDSGKEAKVASDSGAECILVIRPQNLKIREYYLTMFPSITSFCELELVERK